MGKWKKPKGRQRRWNRRCLLNKHGAICGICEEPILCMKDVTLDHIVPRAKGGLNELDNLQLAHEKCNQAKADMLPEEWEALQEM